MIPLRSYKRILVALLSFGPVYGVWMNDLRPPHPVPDTGPNISCLTRDSGGGHPLQITSLDKLTDQNTPAHIDHLISAGSGSNNGTIFPSSASLPTSYSMQTHYCTRGASCRVQRKAPDSRCSLLCRLRCRVVECAT